jgi:hypothetical protein
MLLRSQGDVGEAFEEVAGGVALEGAERFAFRSSFADASVEVGAATCEARSPSAKAERGPISAPAPPGVTSCGAEGEEIGVGRERTMRSKLRGVDEDRWAAVVRAFDGEGGRPPVARLMSRMRRALGGGVAPVEGFLQGAVSCWLESEVWMEWPPFSVTAGTTLSGVASSRARTARCRARVA